MSIYHVASNIQAPKGLQERKQYLEKMQAKLERRLSSAPKGRLSTSRKKKGPSIGFYLVDTNGKRIYLGRSKEKLLARMAQKEYDRKALRLVKDELQKLSALQDYYDLPKLEDALEQCLPEKRPYIAPAVPSDEDFRLAWLAQDYDQKKPSGNDHPYPTEKGDMVCSKTEELEADYMYYHSYDYLYEKRLDLIDNGRPTWRYPDFTILDPVTREEVIFEHFGMVDKEEYRHTMFDKIRLYEENGYVIGKNFLFTFETAEHPFTMDQFIRILEARFPR